MATFPRVRTIDWGISGALLTYKVIGINKEILAIYAPEGIEEYPVASGNYRVVVVWNPNWIGEEIWTDGITTVTESFDGQQFIDQVSTPIIAVANLSLSEVTDANEYFGNRLYTESWFKLTDDKKQQTLNLATQIINSFNYLGFKTLQDQRDEWPRLGIQLNGSVLDKSIIPNDILIAEYEISNSLAQGIEPEREIRSLRIISRGYSSVRTTYDPRSVPEHLKYGVPSSLAWSYLSTYLNRNARNGIKLHRVS